MGQNKMTSYERRMIVAAEKTAGAVTRLVELYEQSQESEKPVGITADRSILSQLATFGNGLSPARAAGSGTIPGAVQINEHRLTTEAQHIAQSAVEPMSEHDV